MTGFCKYKERCRSNPVTTLGITVDLQGAFCERCFSASVGFGSNSNTLTSGQAFRKEEDWDVCVLAVCSMSDVQTPDLLGKGAV